MRKIGTIDDRNAAALLSDNLFGHGIENTLEEENGAWSVWVNEEEQLEAGHELLQRFLSAPEHEEWQQFSGERERRERAREKELASFKRKTFDRERIAQRSRHGDIPLTKALMVISLIVTAFGGLGSGSPVTQWLSITEYDYVNGAVVFSRGLPEIMHGQLWRLFTPAFLHASPLAGGIGFLHILFNMIWLYDLGGMMERAQGWKRTLFIILVAGVVSNYVQYLLAGPSFGGMSGVVYALLGYIWLRGKQDLTSGLYVHSQTMSMMIFWFVLCLLGIMGAVANGAHAGGLVVGLLWGYMDSKRVNAKH